MNTDKLNFFSDAILDRRHIAAVHTNDVFCEFADKFYYRKSYKTTLQNFKKYMKEAATRKGHEVHIGKVDYIDRIDFGVRNIWSINYKY